MNELNENTKYADMTDEQKRDYDFCIRCGDSHEVAMLCLIGYAEQEAHNEKMAIGSKSAYEGAYHY